MTVLQFLSVMSMTIYAILGIYAWLQDRSSPINRTFLVSCLLLAIWSGCYSFVYVTTDRDDLWFWFKLSSFGWCSYPSFIVLFLAYLFNARALIKSPVFFFLVFAFPVLFIAKVYTGFLTAVDFAWTSYGNVEIQQGDSPWFWGFTIYAIACLVGVLAGIWMAGKRAVYNRVKMQARIIFVSMLVTFVATIAVNLIMPAVFKSRFPALGPMFPLILAVGILYAMSRYNLMTISSSLAAEQIVAASRDLIFLTDDTGRIVKVNEAVTALVPDPETLAGAQIGDVFVEQEKIAAVIDAAKRQEHAAGPALVHLRKSGSEPVPVRLQVSAFTDNAGDPLGAAIVGENMSHTEALRESEERYRLLFTQSPLGIVHGNRDGVIMDVNDSFTSIFGVPREEIIGFNTKEIDDPLMKKAIDDALSGKTSQYEGTYKSQYSGKTIYLRVLTQPIKSPSGEIVSSIGIFEDITERKRMENALRESEERFRNIFENIHEGLFQSTPDGRFLSVNKAMARMCGYASPEEMVGMIRDIATQHYTDPFRCELFRKIIEDQGSIQNFQHEVYRRDGSRIWVSINARVVRGGRDEVLYYEGTHEDVTERKLMEDMLRENERRYRHLVENSSDIVYTTDLSGSLTYVNPSAEKLTGYPVSQLLGKHIDFIVRPEYREKLNEFYRRQILEKIPGTYYEFSIMTREGIEKWLGQQTQLIYDKEKVAGLQATARDITDRLKAEDEKRQREKLSAIVETAGMVCHEMNQPMQVILGNADLLALNMAGDDARRKRIDEINGQIRRMGEITKKLMGITRYETKQYVGEVKIVDLDKSADSLE